MRRISCLDNMKGVESNPRMLHRRRTTFSSTAALTLSGALSLSLLSGCESTDKKPAPAGNLLLHDENNYTSNSTLSVPTIETAPATDLDICWANVNKDLQCHDVAPQADLDNLAMLRFRNLSEDQVEVKLTSGELIMSQVDGYLE